MKVTLRKETRYGKLWTFKQWGVSGPVVSALDSGSKGPGSSPTRGMSLYP